MSRVLGLLWTILSLRFSRTLAIGGPKVRPLLRRREAVVPKQHVNCTVKLASTRQPFLKSGVIELKFKRAGSAEGSGQTSLVCG